LNFNLRMLNLWIGLCRGDIELPSGLRDLGYENHFIELPFNNEELERVCPDLIVTSEEMQHTILLEFKSGPNCNEDQLRRYSRISTEDLKTRAFVRSTAAGSHDVAIVGQSEHSERLITGVEGYSFPLVVAETGGLVLILNSFQADETNEVFSPRLEIDWQRAPRGYVPVNAESESWEVGEVVIPQILSYMFERLPRVGLDVVCNDVCDLWSIMGTPGKNDFRSKVREVLRLASRQHFKEYFRWTGANSSLEIKKNPLELGTDKRSKAFRTLQRLHKQFLEHLRAESGEQMHLYEQD